MMRHRRLSWLAVIACVAVGCTPNNSVERTAPHNDDTARVGTSSVERDTGSSTDSSTFTKSRECGEFAERMMSRPEWRASTDKITIFGWVNHYDAKTDRCYVRITYRHPGAKPPEEPTLTDSVLDAFDHKEVISCARGQLDEIARGAWCSVNVVGLSQSSADCQACATAIATVMGSEY